MATTTSDTPELEERMHRGDAAREIVESVRGVVVGRSGTSAKRVIAWMLLGAALTLGTQPWMALAVGLLVWLLLTDSRR